MNEQFSNLYTSFDGYRRIALGSLQANALAVKRAIENGAAGPVLIFDNATGRSIDVDTRGTEDELAARLAEATLSAQHSGFAQLQASSQAVVADAGGAESRGRGRPKLGVIPREVTLLPRHWEWLGAQPGGASVALRKLVEEARRAATEKDRVRKAQERTYHFMLAIAGDLPGFEEATRALFADGSNRFSTLIAAWPADVRDHAVLLGFGGDSAEAPGQQ